VQKKYAYARTIRAIQAFFEKKISLGEGAG